MYGLHFHNNDILSNPISRVKRIDNHRGRECYTGTPIQNLNEYTMAHIRIIKSNTGSHLLSIYFTRLRLGFELAPLFKVSTTRFTYYPVQVHFIDSFSDFTIVVCYNPHEVLFDELG